MTKYSKQTYEDTANIILHFQVVCAKTNDLKTMVHNFAHSFAQLYEKDNPRFDRKRFLIACGVVE